MIPSISWINFPPGYLDGFTNFGISDICAINWTKINSTNLNQYQNLQNERAVKLTFLVLWLAVKQWNSNVLKQASQRRDNPGKQNPGGKLEALTMVRNPGDNWNLGRWDSMQARAYLVRRASQPFESVKLEQPHGRGDPRWCHRHLIFRRSAFW